MWTGSGHSRANASIQFRSDLHLQVRANGHATHFRRSGLFVVDSSEANKIDYFNLFVVDSSEANKIDYVNLFVVDSSEANKIDYVNLFVVDSSEANKIDYVNLFVVDSSEANKIDYVNLFVVDSSEANKIDYVNLFVVDSSEANKIDYVNLFVVDSSEANKIDYVLLSGEMKCGKSTWRSTTFWEQATPTVNGTWADNFIQKFTTYSFKLIVESKANMNMNGVGTWYDNSPASNANKLSIFHVTWKLPPEKC